uniref:Starch-binding domain-containing protein 1 n=1 Tax=Pelusios castaneus TaxID=367368 RepID=A0A8C8RPD9_9SAUR
MAAGDSPLSQPPSPRPEAASPAGGLWTALLMGLLAALLAWFWYGRGGEEPPAEPEQRGGTEQPAGEPRGAAEPLLENSDCVLSETTASVLASPQESIENLATTPRGEHVSSQSDDAPGECPETESLVKEPSTPLMNYSEFLRSETIGSSPAESEVLKLPEGEALCWDTLAGASPSSGVHKDKTEQPAQTLEYQDLVDHEDWEVVPEHSACGDASKNNSAVNADASDSQNNKELELADFLEADSKAKRVAAVPPMPQNIHVNFRVHYITHNDAQLIAVTGDHECLGEWHNYIPLKCDKDGFWSDTIILPADTKIEWKFILVENRKVTRWEECNNRTLMTEHEDGTAHQWWGYH